MQLPFAMENSSNEVIKLLMVNKPQNPVCVAPQAQTAPYPPWPTPTPLNGRTSLATGQAKETLVNPEKRLKTRLN